MKHNFCDCCHYPCYQILCFTTKWLNRNLALIDSALHVCFLNVTDSCPIAFQLLCRFINPFSFFKCNKFQEFRLISTWWWRWVSAWNVLWPKFCLKCFVAAGLRPLAPHPCVEAAHQDSWLKVNVSPVSREQLLCHRHHSRLYIAENTNSSSSLRALKQTVRPWRSHSVALPPVRL